MLLVFLLQCITTEHVSVLCQTAVSTSCDAVKVKMLSILGYIGKMAAAREDTLEVLKVSESQSSQHISKCLCVFLRHFYQVNQSIIGLSSGTHSVHSCYRLNQRFIRQFMSLIRVPLLHAFKTQ
jgi:hypothetical protein